MYESVNAVLFVTFVCIMGVQSASLQSDQIVAFQKKFPSLKRSERKLPPTEDGIVNSLEKVYICYV